jgi:predicted  nucleic acid-binding Zn-ribbon protein
VVPSTSDSRRSEKENTKLKSEVETLKKRLAAAERVIQMRREQDQSLRESIVMAKQQVVLLNVNFLYIANGIHRE